MLVGIMFIDEKDARSEIEAARERGVDAHLLELLTRTLDQAVADDDDESVQAISQYVARLGPGGAYTVDTPADVVVEKGLAAARSVESAAAYTEVAIAAVLLLAAVVALRGR